MEGLHFCERILWQVCDMEKAYEGRWSD